MICSICPRECDLDPGQTGFCRARRNIDGEIIDENYGKVTSIALDPVEKKPLRRYMPESMVLSIGSYGCNLRCGFCQNNRISMSDCDEIAAEEMTVDQIIKIAEDAPGNIGIAYTYNEPLIGFEWVYDCSIAIREKGLKNIVVTNGYIQKKPLVKLMPYIDAVNIDLKAFNSKFYKSIGGDLERVKSSIALIKNDFPNTHIEITTLIIPDENDSEEEMDRLSSWLSSIDKDMPLHISRFFSSYKYMDRSPTPIPKIMTLSEIAERHLSYVYPGNC